MRQISLCARAGNYFARSRECAGNFLRGAGNFAPAPKIAADVWEVGEGWSDGRIIKALETGPSMVYRVRKQLVEEGFEAVLSRKQCATLAVARIFDGEKEAKLIALACSQPPKVCARWTLRLLENKVVELNIVDRASNSTIGRALKKHSSAPSPTVLGHPAQGQQRVRSGDGRRVGRLHAATRSRPSLIRPDFQGLRGWRGSSRLHKMKLQELPSQKGLTRSAPPSSLLQSP